MAVDPIVLTQSIINGILNGLLYSLAALGLALIFGVMDIINFAHGDFIMIAAYLTFIFAVSLNIDAALTAVLTMPIFFVLGLGIYKGIIEKILGAEPLIQIATTVGLLLVLRNLALAIFHAEPKSIHPIRILTIIGIEVAPNPPSTKTNSWYLIATLKSL